MDPLLLCSAPRLSLCGAPTVSPCSEPQPIGADVPSLLCSAPSIMLCGELQPVGADMPILIHGAQAPKVCSTLAMTRIMASFIALPGSASASTGRGAFSFSSSRRLMAEAALWWVGMLGKGGCATGCACRLRASCTAYAQYRQAAENR